MVVMAIGLLFHGMAKMYELSLLQPTIVTDNLMVTNVGSVLHNFTNKYSMSYIFCVFYMSMCMQSNLWLKINIVIAA